MFDSPAFKYPYPLLFLLWAAVLGFVWSPAHLNQKLAAEHVLRQRAWADAEVVEAREGQCAGAASSDTWLPCVLVRYRFKDGEETYEKTAGFSGRVKEAEATYKPGGRFVACYDYADPDNSMLYPRPHRCGEG